jgi:hypothetical protein
MNHPDQITIMLLYYYLGLLCDKRESDQKVLSDLSP